MTMEGGTVIRTQISLDEGKYRQVKQEASRLGISTTDFARRAVRQTPPVNAGMPLRRDAGFVASGEKHSSQKVDEVV